MWNIHSITKIFVTEHQKIVNTACRCLVVTRFLYCYLFCGVQVSFGRRFSHWKLILPYKSTFLSDEKIHKPYESFISLFSPKSGLRILKRRIHSRTCSENLFFHELPANELRRQFHKNCSRDRKIWLWHNLQLFCK